MEKEQELQVQGWKDVQITPDMPASALVQFLNVLNQRLVAVEDNVITKNDNGKPVSLTDLYAEQAKVELAARQAAAEKAEAEQPKKEEN